MSAAAAEITETVARKVLDVVDAGLVKGVGKPVPGQMCVEAAVCYALGLPHGDEPNCVSSAIRKLKINLNDSGWSSNQARAKGLRRLALAQLGSASAVDDREFARRVAELAVRQAVPAALRSAAKVLENPDKKAALLAAANRCEAEGTREAALKAAYAAADTANAAYAAYAAYATEAAWAAEAAANATDATEAAWAAKAAAAAAAEAAYAEAAYAAAYAANAAYATEAAWAAEAAANATDATEAAWAAKAAYAEAAYAAAYAANAAYADVDKTLSNFAEGVVQILISMNAPGCRWLSLTEAA